MMLVACPVCDAEATCYRTIFGGGVVLGDHDHGGSQGESHQRAFPQLHGCLAHQGLCDEVERDRRNGGRHDDALVKGIHDLSALLGRDEEGADDGGHDGNGAEHHREQHGSLAHVDHHQAAQQHGGDQGDGVGFEEVGRHAGAVAHIVADIVGDDRGIARIILRDACLDLADEVCTHVRPLGEYSAAQAREDRDQRPAERQTDQRPKRRFGVPQQMQHDDVVSGHAQQPQAHHQHAGDGAAAEGDLERGIDSIVRRLCGAHVRANRDEHADVAGKSGQNGADGESPRRGPAQTQAQNQEQNDADHGDGGVLAVEVGAGTGLNGRRDFLHSSVARWLRQDPTDRNQSIHNRYYT